MSDEDAPVSSGHLNPGDPQVTFDRFRLGDDLAELVRHVWVVRWRLQGDAVRAQRVLTYPAFNVVIQPGGVCRLHPPRSHVQRRELRGVGWAVGLLLRPGASTAFCDEPAAIPAEGADVDPAPTVRVERLMTQPEPRADLVSTLRSWLGPLTERLDEPGRVVNAACVLAEEDPSILRVADLADRVGTSPRTLERLVRARVGVTPKWLIECRRMQAAATTLRADPDADLSGLAADLGFTDYPHFSRTYRRIIGETPQQTARAGM